MRAFLFLCGLVFCFLIFGIASLNVSNTVNIEYSFLNIKANIGFLIFLSGIFGSIATILFLLSFASLASANKDKLKKQIEDAKLSFEVKSDQIRQLEEKIKTLEEALKIASKQ